MKNFNPIVEKIYHKTKDNDLIVLGDRVYSGRYRIQFTKKKHMTLVAKLHLAFLMPLIAKKIFYLIKMQVLFVCTERNMALKKAKVGRKWIDLLLRKLSNLLFKNRMLPKKRINLKSILLPLRVTNIFSEDIVF